MMTKEEAYEVFCRINTASSVDAPTVYWEALDAERWGRISVYEMDAISVYHKAAIVEMWRNK